MDLFEWPDFGFDRNDLVDFRQGFDTLNGLIFNLVMIILSRTECIILILIMLALTQPGFGLCG